MVCDTSNIIIEKKNKKKKYIHINNQRESVHANIFINWYEGIIVKK